MNMNSPTTHIRARPIQGLTLIELMVSITIGLVLMIAIASAYLGSSSAGRMAEAQARMNEDAQNALAILVQQIRVAGDNPKQPNYAAANPTNPAFGTTTYIVRGCDGTFTNITSAASVAALTCNAGSNSLPDSIAISYEADRYNTVATSSGLATDCLGNQLTPLTATVNVLSGTTTVPTAVTYTVADNRFYVASVGSIPTLYCKGSGNSTPQPIVENVEDLQLLYGTATASTPAAGTRTIAGYLDANSVETETTLATLKPDSPHRWDLTMTIKICVLVRSELPVVSDAASAKYVPCFANPPDPVDAPDLRLRRAYYSTVVMRNRLQPNTTFPL